MHDSCGVTGQNAYGVRHIFRLIVLYAKPSLDAPSLDGWCISVKMIWYVQVCSVVLENRDAPHNVSGLEDPFDSENVESYYYYYLLRGLWMYHGCLCDHCPIRKVCCKH